MPPSSVDPIVEKVNEHLIMILSGEVQERSIKLFSVKEKEFVSIYKNMNSPFYGGLGSTLTKYNDELYIFFGLGQQGYISNISSLHIE
jgi:hypothetical protein